MRTSACGGTGPLGGRLRGDVRDRLEGNATMLAECAEIAAGLDDDLLLARSRSVEDTPPSTTGTYPTRSTCSRRPRGGSRRSATRPRAVACRRLRQGNGLGCGRRSGCSARVHLPAPGRELGGRAPGTLRPRIYVAIHVGLPMPVGRYDGQGLVHVVPHHRGPPMSPSAAARIVPLGRGWHGDSLGWWWDGVTDPVGAEQ